MMDQKTVKALKASIKHWEEIVSAKSVCYDDIGPSSCALCGLFNNGDTQRGQHCNGCPVSERTGAKLCGGTPYDEVEGVLYGTCHYNSDKPTREFTKVAKRELEFLKSLLPEGDQNET